MEAGPHETLNASKAASKCHKRTLNGFRIEIEIGIGIDPDPDPEVSLAIGGTDSARLCLTQPPAPSPSPVVTQAQELEEAILARGERLANAYRERANRARDQILRDAADSLRMREQREEAIAKALGERTYRQQVQAEELKLQSHLDGLRWNLVRDVEHRLAESMRTHVASPDLYLATLTGFIATAAAAIECDELVVAANPHDLKLLESSWSKVKAALPEGKQATLAGEPIDAIAGVLITGNHGRIRVDNTFDGRMARLRPRIQQRILERLLPNGFDTGALLGG